MFDLKKRNSLTLRDSRGTEEFRRVAVRRKVQGPVGDCQTSDVSSGVRGSYNGGHAHGRVSGSELMSKIGTEKDDEKSPMKRSPFKPQVPPKPDHLQSPVFCSRLTEEAGRGSFPPEVIRNIFANISSIYSFHSQFLLPDLENCITHWCKSPGLGKVLLQHAPFLRMYADYVRNFDHAMELVRTWTERSSAFRNIIQDIQSRGICGKLTLQHHMLEPIQRVPRYEMLLKDYLKKLPEDDPDYEITQSKLSFNNFLLCCSPKFSLVGQRFTVRCRIGMDGMQVQQTTNEDHPYSFQISGRERILELQASSKQDRDEWIKVIREAIDVFQKKNDTFRLASRELTVAEPTEELGKRAPRWIRDHEVILCMSCMEPFNALTRRRHHCRACGFDLKPLFTIPLLGCSVEAFPQAFQGQSCFCLTQSKTRHTFTCDSLDIKRSWLSALKVAVTGWRTACSLAVCDNSRGIRSGINGSLSGENFVVSGNKDHRS
ncbi:FYVE, RhoGEF and PH domain-containing protein 4-like [Neolamprologus brichardi]|uniref:FYVE, RhoGEF and PH domain-containing protein 4-like n=1 Tax=Neolamprologus brichardi TaxID=32507 RepID=UPI001643DA6C|nr:FYVE, RhoGEF and PH domain-containing protein 4-like [Neolamprologus brichardi]